MPNKELRQQVEKLVIFARRFNQIGNEGWNETIDQIMSLLSTSQREAKLEGRLDELLVGRLIAALKATINRGEPK